MRLGKREPSRRFILAITDAMSAITGEPVRPEQLFERADLLLESSESRLRAVHVRDLRIIDRMLDDVHEDGWPEKVLDRGVSSETAVRHLHDAAQKRLTTAPREAVLIQSAAAAMSARLGDATPPELKASLRATALKGRANALRHLGRFDEALADLRSAAKLFAAARYCTAEAAQVEYSRGAVLFTMERWAQAIAAAQNARQLAVAANDMHRVAHADVLLAACYLEQGNVAAAHDILLRVERLVTALHDELTLARVWHNLAVIEIKRRRRAQALDYLTRAAAIFRRRGNRIELVRTGWSLAAYHREFTGQSTALSQLRTVRHSFAEIGDRTNAACVALDMLDILSDRAPEGDRHLARFARTVAGELLALGLPVSAAHAVDQLRRIALASDRHAIVAGIRSAMRRLDSPCLPAWSEANDDDATGAGEAGPVPGPASSD